MSIPQILVVDDDPEVREMLTLYLQKHGFAVHSAADATGVRAIVSHHRLDLILLDVMLGDDSGLAICQALRLKNAVPIIMMSALSADHHRMQGYGAGADDYVAKPFNPDLLLARILAVVRRTHRSASLSYRRENKIYDFDNWRFDARSEELHSTGGFEVVLSKREIALLKVFLANAFIPLSREEIASALPNTQPGEKNGPDSSDGRAIDVLLGRLRQKLEMDAKKASILKTMRGTGYMLAVEVQVRDAP